MATNNIGNVEFSQPQQELHTQPSVVGRVQIRESPLIYMYHQHHVLPVTIDSGATSSMIQLSTATRLGLPINKTTQRALQADGNTGLDSCGEVEFVLTHGSFDFFINAMVVSKLGCEFLAGMPFLEGNGAVVDASRRIVSFRDSSLIIPFHDSVSHKHCVPEDSGCLLRANANMTIFPGDYAEFPVTDSECDGSVMVEPKNLASPLWPTPTMTNIISGCIRLPNDTPHPVTIKKHQHVALVSTKLVQSGLANDGDRPVAPKPEPNRPPSKPYSGDIQIDPDAQFTPTDRQAFIELHQQYDSVFNPTIGRYNDASGRLRASINMGPVKPPKTKGHLPNYARHQMSEL